MSATAAAPTSRSGAAEHADAPPDAGGHASPEPTEAPPPAGHAAQSETAERESEEEEQREEQQQEEEQQVTLTPLFRTSRCLSNVWLSTSTSPRSSPARL